MASYPKMSAILASMLLACVLAAPLAPESLLSVRQAVSAGASPVAEASTSVAAQASEAPTAQPSVAASAPASPAPSQSSEPSQSFVPSESAAPSATASESAPAPSASSSTSMSPTPTTSASASATMSASPSISASTSPSVSASVSPTASASMTTSPSVSASVSASISMSASPGSSMTSTPSMTPSASVSASVTPTASVSATASSSPSVTASISVSPSEGATLTPEPSPSVSSSVPATQSAAVSTSPVPSLSAPELAPLTDVTPGPVAASSPVCFPHDATVMTESGSMKRMAELEIGDRIAVGNGLFSEVFMFTHKLVDVAHEFVSIKTAAGPTIRLTSGHYLPVNGIYVSARDAKVGDMLSLADGTISRVTEIRTVAGTGLYNPQTAHGDIIVDGIRASTYTTAVERNMAHALLAPLRFACDRLGLHATFLEAGADSVARVTSVFA